MRQRKAQPGVLCIRPGRLRIAGNLQKLGESRGMDSASELTERNSPAELAGGWVPNLRLRGLRGDAFLSSASCLWCLYTYLGSHGAKQNLSL